MLVIIAHRFTCGKKIKHQTFSEYYESNTCSNTSNTYQISGSVIKKTKSKAEFSQKQLLRKSYRTFITKVLVKNVIERVLFLYYAITFSQVQTDISTNCFFFFFCICVSSFDKNNNLFQYTKTLLLALKGRMRTYLSYYSRHPRKP